MEQSIINWAKLVLSILTSLLTFGVGFYLYILSIIDKKVSEMKNNMNKKIDKEVADLQFKQVQLQITQLKLEFDTKFSTLNEKYDKIDCKIDKISDLLFEMNAKLHHKYD